MSVSGRYTHVTPPPRLKAESLLRYTTSSNNCGCFSFFLPSEDFSLILTLRPLSWMPSFSNSQSQNPNGRKVGSVGSRAGLSRHRVGPVLSLPLFHPCSTRPSPHAFVNERGAAAWAPPPILSHCPGTG